MQSDVLQELLPQRAHTEGLTPALLQEYLTLVDTRQSAVLQRIYEQAAQHYSQPVGEDEPAAVEHAMEVDAVAQTLPDAEVASLAAQHAALRDRLAAVQGETSAAAAAADLQARLADFDAEVAAGAYSGAAWAARQVEREAAELAAPDAPPPDAAVAALHAAFAGRQAALLQMLGTALDNGVWADMAAGQLWAAQRLGDAGAPPAEVWRALAALGVRSARVDWLSGLLLEQTLLPLVREPPGSWPAREEGDGAATLTWRGQPEAPDATLESVLLSVLQFVSGWVLQDEAETVQELGTLLWPRLAAAYLEARLAPHPPADGARGEAFQAAAAAATAFEDGAAAAGWVPGVEPGADASTGRIHVYIKHALNRYLHAKRLSVVSSARELMRGDAYEETVGAGAPLPNDGARLAACAAAWVDTAARLQARLQAQRGQGDGGEDAFAFSDGDAGGVDVYAGGGPDDLQHLDSGPYQVTRRGAGLAALVGQALDEAAAAGAPAVTGLMAGAARDVAALLVAPPPPSQAAQLQVPQLAALRHNDTWHLASVLAAAPDARPRLASLAADGASGPSLDFDAEASALRGAASATLQALIQAQTWQLGELLAGADHFRKVDNSTRAINARKVVSQLLAALRRAGSVLGGVLPPAALVATASALLQFVAASIIGDILALQDISVDESEELPQILHTLVDDGPAAAVGPRGPAPPAAADALLQAVRDATPALLQLQVLLEVLNARLADIRGWWAGGALQMRGFGAPQVAHLIRSLFSPTEMRAQVLSEVEGQ